jgi:hypothetical protein
VKDVSVHPSSLAATSFAAVCGLFRLSCRFHCVVCVVCESVETKKIKPYRIRITTHHSRWIKEEVKI